MNSDTLTTPDRDTAAMLLGWLAEPDNDAVRQQVGEWLVHDLGDVRGWHMLREFWEGPLLDEIDICVDDEFDQFGHHLKLPWYKTRSILNANMFTVTCHLIDEWGPVRLICELFPEWVRERCEPLRFPPECQSPWNHRKFNWPESLHPFCMAESRHFLWQEVASQAVESAWKRARLIEWLEAV